MTAAPQPIRRDLRGRSRRSLPYAPPVEKDSHSKIAMFPPLQDAIGDAGVMTVAAAAAPLAPVVAPVSPARTQRPRSAMPLNQRRSADARPGRKDLRSTLAASDPRGTRFQPSSKQVYAQPTAPASLAVRSPQSPPLRPVIPVNATPVPASARPLAQPSVPAPVTRTINTTAVSTPVKPLPNRMARPLWLRYLLLGQRLSTPLTLMLIAGVSVIYGWMVYTQQAWSRSYSELEQLQRQERQLLSTDEVLKHQLAEQATQPESGLALPNLDNTLFLPAPAPRPPVNAAPAIAPSTYPSAPVSKPLGY